MTPEPPASSDGSSLPPRHRPSLGNLARDTTETDLWAFEEDLDAPEEVVEPTAAEPQRSSGRDIPAPRERPLGKIRGAENHSVSRNGEGVEKIRFNVNKARTKSRPSETAAGSSTPESEFDDLEHWEDAKSEPEIEELPAESVTETIMPVQEETAAVEVAPDIPPPSAGSAAADDELAPVVREGASPISLRPHLRLTKVERIGLIALLVLLLGGGSAVFFTSLNRLPVESAKAESNDFPIKGDHVIVSSATSYWRAPITEGPEIDTFRRGTELLPVLELAVSGGPAAIRVLFRNDDGMVVGDAVTRSIRGTDRLKIAATAGFDDPGMHAAYRTGESKPWTIEVYEARTEDATGKDFKRLFEMNISTDRR